MSGIYILYREKKVLIIFTLAIDILYDIEYNGNINWKKELLEMMSVEKFSDYGVRIGDAVKYQLNPTYRVQGVIKELYEGAIVVKKISVNYDKDADGPLGVAYIPKEQFDEFKLEIFDDNRGCDNSAIGLSGCYEPWDRMWF